jgi:uncharacterized protein YkwD
MNTNISWRSPSMAVSRLMTLLALGACATPAPVVSKPSLTPGVAVSPASPIADEVVTRTNAQRRALGLDELRRSSLLMQAAQLHAEQMASARRMAHDLPGMTYPTLRDRLDAVKYPWRAIGENVAEGYSDPATAVTGWMKSTAHRENMTSSRFTEMGAGSAVGTNGRRYWVQVFAAPR